MNNNVLIMWCISISSLSIHAMEKPVNKQMAREKKMVTAALTLRSQTFKALLEKGVKIDTTDSKGNSLLIKTLERPFYTAGHLLFIKNLLDQPGGNALVTKRGENNYTPLQILLNGLSPEETKHLPSGEIDPAQNEKRKTSAKFGIHILDLLLSRGADPYAPGYEEKNTFDLAEELEIPKLTWYMQEKRASFLKLNPQNAIQLATTNLSNNLTSNRPHNFSTSTITETAILNVQKYRTSTPALPQEPDESPYQMFPGNRFRSSSTSTIPETTISNVQKYRTSTPALPQEPDESPYQMFPGNRLRSSSTSNIPAVDASSEQKYRTYTPPLSKREKSRQLLQQTTRPRADSKEKLWEDLNKYFNDTSNDTSIKSSDEEPSLDEHSKKLLDAWINYFDKPTNDTPPLDTQSSNEQPATFQMKSTSCCDIL